MRLIEALKGFHVPLAERTFPDMRSKPAQAPFHLDFSPLLVFQLEHSWKPLTFQTLHSLFTLPSSILLLLNHV